MCAYRPKLTAYEASGSLRAVGRERADHSIAAGRALGSFDSPCQLNDLDASEGRSCVLAGSTGPVGDASIWGAVNDR